MNPYESLMMDAVHSLTELYWSGEVDQDMLLKLIGKLEVGEEPTSDEFVFLVEHLNDREYDNIERYFDWLDE